MAAESEKETDIDPIEIQKQYNPEEPRYPLDYEKYIRMKKD